MNPIQFAQWLSIPWGLSEAIVFLRDRQPGTGKQVDRGSRAIILAALVLTMWLRSPRDCIRWRCCPDRRSCGKHSARR